MMVSTAIAEYLIGFSAHTPTRTIKGDVLLGGNGPEGIEDRKYR